MTQALVSIAYKSRSTDRVVDSETLASILSAAQRSNVANHLTGALAYGDGHFIQVLEGPEEGLVPTMDRIRADVRHHGLEVFGPTPIIHRMFPDWCMALLSVEPALHPVFSALVADWATIGPRAAALLATSLQD